MEGAILVWFIVGAGIAAGAFVLARSAIQIASVGYGVLEKRLDPRVATRQTVLLTVAALAALVATSIIRRDRDPRDPPGPDQRERSELGRARSARAPELYIVFGASGMGRGWSG